MNAIGTACNFRRHCYHGVKDEFRLSARLTIRVIRKVADSYRTEFAQQRYDIEYKAKLSGVPMVPVDPAYTSQRCSVCGFVHEDNGKTQASFVCLSCGHAEHAA